MNLFQLSNCDFIFLNSVLSAYFFNTELMAGCPNLGHVTLNVEILDTRGATARKGVEPYRKCPFCNHQSQQRIQILGYHTCSIDALIRENI